MSKKYIVVSRARGTNNNVILGVVANASGRKNTVEERQEIITLLRETGARMSLLDALRDGEYREVSVFDKRAAARAECNSLNNPEPGLTTTFKWSVLEFGEGTVRQFDPRTLLGWRIVLMGDHISILNAPEYGATVKQPSGYLFPNRKDGRAAMKANAGDDPDYSLVQVYA